jgi:uncharacterized protein
MKWYHEKQGYFIVRIKVKPNARQTMVLALKEQYIEISLKDLPQDGKANTALVKFLAKSMKIAQSKVAIIRGDKSKIKVLTIACDKHQIKSLID